MCHARGLRPIAALLLALLAVACGPKTKHDVLARAEKIETKAELERALGAPDERDKLGPIEIWTYEASDGSVTFVITGDKVTLQATGEREPD
jgi:hypothetical protein